MNVTVLMGGTSDERDVSLASGCEVAQALRLAGHDVQAVDTVSGLLSSEQERAVLDAGVGRIPPDHLRTSGAVATVTGADVADADVVFPALHGGQGEDGTLQALLDLAGVTYAGSGMLGCAVSMDKDVSKRLLREAGVDTPDWVVDPPSAEQALDALSLPVILKPVSGGSSIGLVLAGSAEELEAALESGRRTGEPMMVEALVGGRELTVGVLGDEALPVGEIVTSGELFDYESKYQPGLAEEIFPADIPEATAEELKRLALRVHRLLRLRDFSRVDFMLDEDGRAWCLEANALPGLTAHSLLPKAARAAGIEFHELCDRIVQLALAREGRAERVHGE